MANRQLVSWRAGHTQPWQPTTLDRIGKDEKFLEDILAANPGLMGLESRRTGVYGPFCVFQQLSMKTPSERGIYPDIVLLSASGHVIVVEVKRAVNSELRDRAVIAQIIDYASSFASLSEEDVLALFSTTDVSSESWIELIQTLFPEEDQPDELADVLLQRMQSGEINLVIACDGIPPGLPDVVAGIASQKTVGFDLDLVEIVPFVRRIEDDAEILFVPSTRLATEIVSRTAVTVTYRPSDEQPVASVQTASIEEIEKAVEKTRRGVHPDARTWTPVEIDEEFRNQDIPELTELLEFAQEYSADGQYTTSGRKISPTFGFRVAGKRDDGTATKLLVFVCNLSWGVVYVYANSAERITDEDTVNEFRQRLGELFDTEYNSEAKEIGIQITEVSGKLTEFRNLMLWLKGEVERIAATR